MINELRPIYSNNPQLFINLLIPKIKSVPNVAIRNSGNDSIQLNLGAALILGVVPNNAYTTINIIKYTPPESV